MNSLEETDSKISNYNDINSFFNRLLTRFAEGDYEGARKSYYAALGSYSRLFDSSFLIRCSFNEWRYSPTNPENKKLDYRTLTHLRFCADLYEFSCLVFRQNKKGFNYSSEMDFGRSYFKMLGFSRLIDFKTLYIKHETDLSKISIYLSPRELLDYMYHVIFLFGGLWRYESPEIFTSIYESQNSPEWKFYQAQTELSICMSIFGVFRPPMYVEIIMPRDIGEVPKSIEDTMLYNFQKNNKSVPVEIMGWGSDDPLAPIKEAYLNLPKKKINYGEHVPFIEKMNELLNRNQSTDTVIYGVKGDGKSSLGMGLCYQADESFDVDHIVFSMDEYLNAIRELEPCSYIIFDETGTQSSGMSSRDFMSNKNKSVVDIWQMARTNQICTIAITLDAGRIDNRIRETFRYHMAPIMKLSNDDTKGHGLANVCEVREIIKAKSAEGSDTLFNLKSARPNGISWLSVPMAPKQLIYKYEQKRDVFRKAMMDAAMEAQKNPPKSGKRGRA